MLALTNLGRKVFLSTRSRTTLPFGALLNKRQDDSLAQQTLAEMTEDKRFHPALLRMHQGFLDSYFELKEVDAAPNFLNLRKVIKTFWQISVNFKRMRVKEFRRRLADAALEQRHRRALLEGVPSLPEPASSTDMHDDADASEMSDGLERGSGVRMPARRFPRRLRGAHKGSGVPNQKAFRW